MVETNEKSNNSFIVNIGNKDLAILIARALSGGSCLPWCSDIEPKYHDSTLEDALSNDGVLLVYGLENVYELTKSKLIMGIQQALPYLTSLINGSTFDVSSIDSDSADFIIQLALFNEVIYD